MRAEIVLNLPRVNELRDNIFEELEQSVPWPISEYWQKGAKFFEVCLGRVWFRCQVPTEGTRLTLKESKNQNPRRKLSPVVGRVKCSEPVVQSIPKDPNRFFLQSERAWTSFDRVKVLTRRNLDELLKNIRDGSEHHHDILMVDSCAGVEEPEPEPEPNTEVDFRDLYPEERE